MSYRVRISCIAVILRVTFGGAARAQQSQVGGLVPFSTLGTPTAITKPTLTLRGGTLLLSDSPEQFKSAGHLPAAMYRDRVQGDFRVFYHHQNETAQTLSVGVAVTNTSNQLEVLFARGKGVGINAAPDVAGQAAAASFISSRRSISFASLLLPGKTYYEVQNLPNGDTASGILEYFLVAIPVDAGATRGRSPCRSISSKLLPPRSRRRERNVRICRAASALARRRSQPWRTSATSRPTRFLFPSFPGTPTLEAPLLTPTALESSPFQRRVVFNIYRSIPPLRERSTRTQCRMSMNSEWTPWTGAHRSTMMAIMAWSITFRWHSRVLDPRKPSRC